MKNIVILKEISYELIMVGKLSLPHPFCAGAIRKRKYFAGVKFKCVLTVIPAFLLTSTEKMGRS